MPSALYFRGGTTRRALLALGALLVVASCASTGFGAASATSLPSATVASTLSLSDPTTLAATPPVCTDAVAPVDTDDCADVSFTAGLPHLLRLGSLSGTDVQAGSLRWHVTTTSSTGYTVRMYNAGTAPVLRSPSGTIADMGSGVAANAVDDATHFGVALGDPAADNESSVAYAGSPWVTGGGQQGELFAGVPTAGVVVANRVTPQTNDPFTATFAVASVAGQVPPPGSYAGTVRVTASVV